MPGTVLLLAAAPAGKGCLVDAASVLPILAAVPPAVLSGTDTANVVELADPLEPQAVLTRLRAAAATPAPLTVFVTGQLHLDRRQHLPHLALARTTPQTVRYTGFPWHWIREELRLRAPGSTTLLLDLHADAETWQWLRANPLDSGRNNAVYGRIAPPPNRRTLAGPTYMKAVATLLRSGHRPPLDQLHQQALARISPEGGMGTDIVLTAQSPAHIPPHIVAQPPVQLRPHSAVQPPRQDAPQTPRHLPPEGSAPVRGGVPGQVLPSEGSASIRDGVSAQVLLSEGSASIRDGVPAQVLLSEGSAPVRDGVPAQVLPPEAPTPTRAQAPAPVLMRQPPLPPEFPASVPAGATAQVLPPESPTPTPAQVSPQESSASAAPVAASAPAQGLPQQSSEGSAPNPAQSLAPSPAQTIPPMPAHSPAPTPAQLPTPAPAQLPAPSPVQPAAQTPTPTDPHAVIAAAAEAGRHGEAEALAAHHEQVALRAHGPASEEALHWIEVRADLAMLAGDAVRSCRTWLTVASARLSAGQAPDAPAVEAAVDRAHHQWGQIKDAAPARELGPVLAELRGRVPGRRRGALENVLQQLRQLQVSG
ncbi:hypothetical protein ACQEV2_21840 [Streptomyces sp. CA-251387]|uniref:hypothetical protein n=1 Tax=Streptomyces sp. CA-251387 TaxID=3240064 RepID=UPI003D8BB38A